MEKDAKRDGKLFNIYNGSVVRNWQPQWVHCFRLETSQDYVTWEGVPRKYLTNLVVVGRNHIRLLAVYHDGHTQELCETSVMDNIRSVVQLHKTLLVETTRKLFGLAYEAGRLRTVYMLSMQFLSINPDYRSFVRVDSFNRYTLIVLNQHLIMCTPKESDLKQYRGTNQFEHLTEEVQWKLPSHDYFYSVYLYNKVKNIGLKDIYDVALDVSSMYFLCREGEHHSVWRLCIENIVREVGSKEPLVTKIFTALPPAAKLIALTPEGDSHLLLLSNSRAIFLPNPKTPTLQPCEIELTLAELTSVKVVGRTTVYLSDSKQIISLQVLPDKLEVKSLFNCKYNLMGFCMLNGRFDVGLSVLLSRTKVLIKKAGSPEPEPISSHLNTIMDFHISTGNKMVLAIEKGDGDANNNRLIAIKRMFRPSDKVLVSSKKNFFEKATGLEDVRGLPIHALVTIKTDGTYACFQDLPDESATFSKHPGLKQSLWLAESTTPIGNFLVLLDRQQTFERYLNLEERTTQTAPFKPDPSKTFLIEHMLISISEEVVWVADLITNEQWSYPILIREGCLKVSVCKKLFHYGKGSHRRHLLFLCYPEEIEGFELTTSGCELIFGCKFANQGLPYLRNHLQDQKEQGSGKLPDLTYLRSITDPDYMLPLHEQLSQAPLVSLLTSQQPDGVVLLLQNSLNEFFLYRLVQHHNDMGGVFVRMVLPVYAQIQKPGAELQPLYEYGKQLIRFGGRVLVDGVVLQATENFAHCFRDASQEIWTISSEGRLKPVDLKGERYSGKIVSVLSDTQSYIGLENSPEYYCAYSRETVELFDKQLNRKGWFSVQEPSSNNQIITAKMSQSYLGVSSYQHYREKNGFESIKFQFTLYDTKVKSLRYDSPPLDEPIIGIRFTRSGKILLISSTRICVYEIRNKLEHCKDITHSQRSMLASAGFWVHQSKQSTQQQIPHFLLMGGLFGGLSFFSYDDEKLTFQENWFEPMKCGLRQTEIFVYGKCLKGMLADQDRNLIVVDLKQTGMEKIADFNIGSRCNKLIKIDESLKGYELICGCFTDGTIQSFVPVKLLDEDVSLLRFQQLMTELLPFVGGLNEREFRRLQQQCRSYKFSSRGNFFEHSMLEFYLSLSKPLQNVVLEKSSFTEDEVRSIICRYCM